LRIPKRGDAGADCPVGVLDGIGELHLLAIFEERACIRDDLRVERVGDELSLAVPII